MRAICIFCILLGGCTTADITLPDGTHVAFQRFWTDAAITADSDGFAYSSNPSDMATQSLVEALLRALGAASRRPIALQASRACGEEAGL